MAPVTLEYQPRHLCIGMFVAQMSDCAHKLQHHCPTREASAEEILRWACREFGSSVAASSSFQTQGVVLLHMISVVCPGLPVFFIDTGYHFPETLAYRDRLIDRFGLNVRTIYPAIEQSELLRRYGEGLYRRDPDLCCYIHKIEPLQRALRGHEAWISGIRGDQSDVRSKDHPMLQWTEEMIDAYIADNKLPRHPLWERGYTSIGCACCTGPVRPGENLRAGRWRGREKTECGLHSHHWWKRGEAHGTD